MVAVAEQKNLITGTVVRKTVSNYKQSSKDIPGQLTLEGMD